jgi:hypothetical protein
MECASLSRTSRSPTMVVAEHAMTVSKPAGWRVAVVVLRYFVAVRLLRHP